MKTFKTSLPIALPFADSPRLGSLCNLEGHFTMEEIFKDIPGYEGIYQASNLGRIKSLYRIDKLNRIVKEKIFDSYSNGSGYFKVSLTKNGKSIALYVHRLIIKTFKGDSDLQVDHINGKRYDNRIENLEYVTARENSKRKKTDKLYPIGVSYEKGSNKFKSSIFIGGKLKNLGRFATSEEASIAYQNKLKTIADEKC